MNDKSGDPSDQLFLFVHLYWTESRLQDCFKMYRLVKSEQFLNMISFVCGVRNQHQEIYSHL